MPPELATQRADIEQRLRTIVADVFRADPSTIQGSTRFVEDLGARSLTMTALVAAVETEFGIKTKATETNKNKTLDETVAYIERKLSEKKPG